MSSNPKKIGILGGTFDPIHYGHLSMAEAARKELGLDRIIFIPTGVSYMKEGVSPNSVRYEMVRLALMDYPDYELSDIEIKREGNTYTCDTIRELKALEPDSDFYFIIGTDTLFMLEKWKDYEFLFENLIMTVCKRNDDNISTEEDKAEELQAKYHANIVFIPFDPVDVSSTEIRKFYRDSYSAHSMPKHESVPESVNDFIYKNNLYREQP